MQLYLIDLDESYCKKLEEMLIIKVEEGLFIKTYSTFEEFKQEDLSFCQPSMIIIDESLVEQGEFFNSYQQKEIPFTVLCEKVLSKVVWDMLLEQGIEAKEIENYCINRFQDIKSFLEGIRNNFLSQGTYQCIEKSQNSKIISFFTPYGDSNFSSLLQSYVMKYKLQQESILLIHYDPFYRSTEQNHFNLSYIFSKIKNKNNNLSWLLSEIVRKIGPDIDCLDGPLHMIDIDYLDDASMEIFMLWLQKSTKYTRIFLNFNGIHISKHVDKLLRLSSKCALLTQKESVQRIMLEQFPYKWFILNGEVENLVKEMIL